MTLEELAHQIIDTVEHVIRRENPEIEKHVPQPDNTFLHGEAYYDLENEIVEILKAIVQPYEALEGEIVEAGLKEAE